MIIFFVGEAGRFFGGGGGGELLPLKSPSHNPNKDFGAGSQMRTLAEVEFQMWCRLVIL